MLFCNSIAGKNEKYDSKKRCILNYIKQLEKCFNAKISLKLHN